MVYVVPRVLKWSAPVHIPPAFATARVVDENTVVVASYGVLKEGGTATILVRSGGEVWGVWARIEPLPREKLDGLTPGDVSDLAAILADVDEVDFGPVRVGPPEPRIILSHAYRLRRVLRARVLPGVLRLP